MRKPKGLRARGRELYRELTAEFEFDQDPHRAALLEDACRTADVIARLQDVVDDAADLRVRGSQGQPVALPELAELRQYRALLASLLKALALPDTDDVAEQKQDHITAVRRAAAKGISLKVVR